MHACTSTTTRPTPRANGSTTQTASTPATASPRWTHIFRTLRKVGFHGWLSLELFNRDYWKQSPQKVAQTGIEKLRSAVRKAFA